MSPHSADLQVRRAVPADCDGILAAHTEAIRELCKAEYSQSQLAAWSDRLKPSGYLPAMEKNIFLVAEVMGRIAGFAEFAPSRGEVVAIYVHPQHARQGVGTRLFREVERLASDKGVSSLHLSSSLSAVQFYERFGFVAGAAGFHRLGNGTEIPCVPMVRAAK
jgi:putative acetyltransferase